MRVAVLCAHFAPHRAATQGQHICISGSHLKHGRPFKRMGRHHHHVHTMQGNMTSMADNFLDSGFATDADRWGCLGHGLLHAIRTANKSAHRTAGVDQNPRKEPAHHDHSW